MKHTIKMPLLIASLLSSLYAKEVITLKPLSVDSTSIKTDELRSTDAVAIYTAKDIQKAHVQNLYQFFNQQTSITTMPSYGNPFTQLLDIRGYGLANGYQNIVITVDGRRLNNIDGLPQLLASISLNSIKRIEIIKSSGIVAAGDGANAGVINIITKQGKTVGEIGLYGGSYGTADGSFYLSKESGKWFVTASGEAKKSSGSRAIDNAGKKDNNQFSNGRFAMSYHASKKLKLHLSAHFSKEDVFYAGYLTQDQYNDDPAQKGTLSTHQIFDINGIDGALYYNINDALSLQIQAQHQKKSSEYISTYGDTTAFYDYNSAQTSLHYSADHVDLVVGSQLFYGQRKGGYYGDSMDKNTVAGYFQSRFHLAKERFQLGYRFENIAYQYKKSATNLQKNNNLHGIEVGYNHLVDKHQSFYANYTHSYLAPVVDSFFNEYTNTFNNFISPMESNNFTLGYNNIQTSNKFKLSIYYISLKNEIYYNPATYTNTNIKRSHKYGLDLLEKRILNRYFTMAIHYNYVQAMIDSGTYADKELPGVSHHNIKATFCYLPNRKTTLALTQTYRSWAYAINDFGNNFAQRQKPYMSTDLSLNYTDKSYELFAKINNLFNQKNGLWIQNNDIYPVNFATSVFAGLKLKF